MSALYVIELLECGVWDTLDEADDLESALILASYYSSLHGDHRLRISTPENSIL